MLPIWMCLDLLEINWIEIKFAFVHFRSYV